MFVFCLLLKYGLRLGELLSKQEVETKIRSQNKSPVNEDAFSPTSEENPFSERPYQTKGFSPTAWSD